MYLRHERIDDQPPCTHLGFCETADLTGNGLPDVVVGGHGPWVDEADRDPDERNLFWYENPGTGGGDWERRVMVDEPGLKLEVGATLGDVSGDGRLDLVSGQGSGDTDVYWFEQPADPREEWRQRLVTDRFEKYHDFAFGDVDGDGSPELVGLSQKGETVFYYDVPADPAVEPWPEDHCHVVAEIRVEGVAIADVDGDGRTEIVAGPNVLHRPESGEGEWTREQVDTGWDDTRVAVADLDGDGDLEVVLSEGDSPHLGTHPGRVAWFDPPGWKRTFLREDFYCPHSLEVADFDGDGRPDVYVAEMGLGENDDPEHVVFWNRGDGEFEKETVARGVATHEAKVVDLTGDGRLDVVGKTYARDPENAHVDAWIHEE